MANPWLERNVTGASYDARMAAKAAAGEYLHGEADFVCDLLGYRPGATAAAPAVLDAGCGTGRVAIELVQRGLDVVGVDLDLSMLEVARAKAPALDWRHADLADAKLHLDRTFDVVLAAGNVMIFLAPGSERTVLANLARHLVEGGALVAGFQLQPGGLSLAGYDAAAGAAGLAVDQRWATWQGQTWIDGGDYAVSVHRRPMTASV